MKIFVAGGTGVIGRRAIPMMLARGHSITALGRSPEKCALLKQRGATVLSVDLFDEVPLARVMDGHDTVVNLATHIPSSSTRMMLPWSWRENDRIRREGSRTLAAAAIRAGVKRFVQESFAPVYEARGDEWIDESCPVRPAFNSRTVLDAERVAESFASDGRTGVVLRFANLYGPDELMREMIRMVRKGWAPLPGRADGFVSSVSQDDAAAAVVAALDVPGGIYNVADDEPVSRGDMFSTLAQVIHAKAPKQLPAWTIALMGSLGELLSRSQRISNTKLISAGGWTPVYHSVKQGFPAVVAELERLDAARSAAA